MAELIKFANTSNIIEFTLKDKTTGQGKTGLSLSTAGLIISTKCDNEATPTVYTQAGSTIETITTLGTFAAPTSTKCRFKEVDAVNHKGLYQFQFADARFAISNSKRLIISVNDAESTIMDSDYQIQLVQFDPYDAIHLGLSAIPNTPCTTNASLITSGTGTDQLSVASGRIDVGKTLGVAVTLDSNNRLLVSSNIIRSGTAQSGSTNSIQLDSGASSITDSYKGCDIQISSGTGINQVRTINSYNGSTKQVTVDRPYFTAPNSSSIFNIIATNSPALNKSLQVVAGTVQIVIWTGTAQTGSTSNSIKLDTGASVTDNIYNNALITLFSGTGVGQSRSIISYNGTTKIATVDKNWIVTPDNTTVFNILASTTPSTFSDSGVAQAGASSTITLASTSSTVSNTYNNSFITILSGTGAGQTKEITGYVGSTHIATVDSAWGTVPDSTSAYAVIPTLGSDIPNVINANIVTPLPANAFVNINNGTYDIRQLLIMVFEMAAYGRISGLPSGPAVLRDFANSLNRATITFDASNNRTGITINNAP